MKVDTSGIAQMGQRFGSVKGKLQPALIGVVKDVGPVAMRAMKGALPGQTGLKAKVINKGLKGRMTGNAYVIQSKGGDIRLKYFGARETAAGVSAAPWNNRKVYAATFTRAGWWPDRKQKIAGGHVLRRKTGAKYPLEVVRSGLYLAEEMVKGESAEALYGTVDARFAQAITAVVLDAI